MAKTVAKARLAARPLVETHPRGTGGTGAALQTDQARLSSGIGDPVPERPGRREPRAVKRRPKPYQLLNRPRHLMKELQHPSKYRKTNDNLSRKNKAAI